MPARQLFSLWLAGSPEEVASRTDHSAAEFGLASWSASTRVSRCT